MLTLYGYMGVNECINLCVCVCVHVLPSVHRASTGCNKVQCSQQTFQQHAETEAVIGIAVINEAANPIATSNCSHQDVPIT